MAKIVKQQAVYSEYERIGEGQGKNDILVGKNFKILSYAKIEGQNEKDNPFCAALVETADGKKLSTTFSNIILKVLESTGQSVGVTQDPADPRINIFKEAIDVTLKKHVSEENKGRSYYTLE
jgi:hypothetical protein